MLYNIAPSNAERVKSQLTVCKIEAPAGYTACYRITHNMLEYELWELARPEYPLYIIKTRNGSDIYFITFGEVTSSTISVYSAEILKNGNPNDTRTERAERYLKKYDQLACAVHGLVSSGLLEEAEELETVKIDGFILEQYKPKPGTYAWRLRTASGEVVTSGHNTPEECKRAALEKAEEYLSHPEKYPKARGNAATVSERVIEALKAAEAPTAPEAVTAEEVHTTAGKDAQRATETATTGDGEQTTTAAAPTPSGDRSTANKMTGSHAGHAKEMTAERSERRKRYLQRMFDELARKRRKARRDAKEMTTGRTTPPRHTCENAPQGPETIRPGQDTTGADTEPPRAAGKATPHRQRGSPNRRKGTFSGGMSKVGLKNRIKNGTPFFDRVFQKN